MLQKRCLHALSRRAIALLTSHPTTLEHSLKTSPLLSNSRSIKSFVVSNFFSTAGYSLSSHRHLHHFSSNSRDKSDNDEEGEETGREDTDAEEGTDTDLKREYSKKEREEEAAAIGYKVIGPLQESERVIKPFEPVFAIVQIGSHQFKVSNGDCVFVEKLKFCEVNDKDVVGTACSIPLKNESSALIEADIV